MLLTSLFQQKYWFGKQLTSFTRAPRRSQPPPEAHGAGHRKTSSPDDREVHSPCTTVPSHYIAASLGLPPTSPQETMQFVYALVPDVLPKLIDGVTGWTVSIQCIHLCDLIQMLSLC